jgi:hypothetical protein
MANFIRAANMMRILPSPRGFSSAGSHRAGHLTVSSEKGSIGLDGCQLEADRLSAMRERAMSLCGTIEKFAGRLDPDVKLGKARAKMRGWGILVRWTAAGRPSIDRLLGGLCYPRFVI